MIRAFRVISILILLAVPLQAQPVQESISVDLVNIYMSATDSRGSFVTDLKPEEFVLKENGLPQNITHFSNFTLEDSNKLGERDVPLTMALVLDKSASMGAEIQGEHKMDIVKNAAFRLLDEMKNDDSTTLISFNHAPTEETQLTSDRKRVGRDVLFQQVEGGDTALLDSIFFALERLNNRSGRKIIVVFSDGEDTASKLKLDEVLANVIDSDVTVLAFGTMALGSGSIRGRYILEKLAEASGGYAFFPSSLNALDGVMDKLRHGMRSQYSMGYAPLNVNRDRKWRTIEITCKRPGVKLRYRKGYNPG